MNKKLKEIQEDIRKLRDADHHVCNAEIVETNASEISDMEAQLEHFKTKEPQELEIIANIEKRLTELHPDSVICTCVEYDKVIDKLENLLEKTPEFRMHPNQACFDGEISQLDWMDMNK